MNTIIKNIYNNSNKIILGNRILKNEIIHKKYDKNKYLSFKLWSYRKKHFYLMILRKTVISIASHDMYRVPSYSYTVQ